MHESPHGRTRPEQRTIGHRAGMNGANSSGNVLIDLGYSEEEAAILQMRADLMADLQKFIKAKNLTQAKAAEILGVSQSRISDLTTGKWERFSLEMLITLATRAGMHIKLRRAA